MNSNDKDELLTGYLVLFLTNEGINKLERDSALMALGMRMAFDSLRAYGIHVPEKIEYGTSCLIAEFVPYGTKLMPG